MMRAARARPTTRLILVCHAATSAARDVRFPADEALDARGVRELSRAGRFGPLRAAWTSPALRARQTAEGLGLVAAIDPPLADLDCGGWAGRSLAEIESAEPAALAAWLSDPEASPHGGESIAALVERIGGWMESRGPEGARLVAVTHAAVIRAAILLALGAPPMGFWRIDVAPLSIAEFSGGGRRWTLRALTPPVGKSGLRRRPAAPPDSDSGG